MKPLLNKRIAITGELVERDGHYILFRVKKDGRKLTNHIMLEKIGRISDKKYSKFKGNEIWATGLVVSYTDSKGVRKYGMNKFKDMQLKEKKDALDIEHRDGVFKNKRKSR